MYVTVGDGGSGGWGLVGRLAPTVRMQALVDTLVVERTCGRCGVAYTERAELGFRNCRFHPIAAIHGTFACCGATTSDDDGCCAQDHTDDGTAFEPRVRMRATTADTIFGANSVLARAHTRDGAFIVFERANATALEWR